MAGRRSAPNLVVLDARSARAPRVVGVTGFGGAAVLLPVLVVAFGVRDAVPILTVAQLIGNGSRVWFNRRALDFRVVGWFALGGVPFAFVGGLLFAPAPISASFLSAPLGSVGPLMAPFFLAYGLVKGAYIGTEALATVVMHVTKLVAYRQAAVLSGGAALTGLALGPLMVAGSWTGKRIVDRLPERAFVLLIEATMIAAGLLFLIRGR